jgi:hypothetical protein
MSVNVNPISPSKPLELSGERYTSAAQRRLSTSVAVVISASQFCDKKEVLDVRSDEGRDGAAA